MACLATKKSHACYIPVVYRQDMFACYTVECRKERTCHAESIVRLELRSCDKERNSYFCNYIEISNKTGFCPDLMMVIAFPVY